MTNHNGNQFRDDEIIVLTENRDGKMVKNIYPKIGGRLRLAHEENDQLSITTEIIK
jgi:phage repressor protein C with HTH and peptisase S24 domain